MGKTNENKEETKVIDGEFREAAVENQEQEQEQQNADIPETEEPNKEGFFGKVWKRAKKVAPFAMIGVAVIWGGIKIVKAIKSGDDVTEAVDAVKEAVTPALTDNELVQTTVENTSEVVKEVVTE